MLDPQNLSTWFHELYSWDAARTDVASEPTATVQYGEHPDQHFDLWVPQAVLDESFGELNLTGYPAIISIHGGYFLEEYDKKLNQPLVRQLLKDGFTVANFEYRRGTGRRHDSLADIQAGLDLFGERYSPFSFAVFGHSAGGYLAERLAVQPRVYQVVLLAPVSDLEEASRKDWDAGGIAAWMGVSPDEDPQAYFEANLCNSVLGSAPRVIIHGDQDTAVNIAQSRALEKAIRARKNDVSLIELEGEGHYGYLDPRQPVYELVREHLSDWNSLSDD